MSSIEVSGKDGFDVWTNKHSMSLVRAELPVPLETFCLKDFPKTYVLKLYVLMSHLKQLLLLEIKSVYKLVQ